MMCKVRGIRSGRGVAAHHYEGLIRLASKKEYHGRKKSWDKLGI